MIQLNPGIPLLTPEGKGLAILVSDYGTDFDLEWTVVLDKNGQIWNYKTSKVRGINNITWGRSSENLTDLKTK